VTGGVADIALEFLGRGGKKLRPRLCRAVFEKCGGRGSPDALCGAVECFHKASLVHDDIQDGDEERYGRPTVWKEHGVPMAIAVGDWLVAHGYKMICESGFAAVPQMLRAAVTSHKRLCEGQGDDIIRALRAQRAFDSAAYVSICERKTGEAFALAAQLGALAAGADDAPFRRYGLSFGILFQINDDLADGGSPADLIALKAKYEDETAFHRDQCAIGVW